MELGPFLSCPIGNIYCNIDSIVLCPYRNWVRECTVSANVYTQSNGDIIVLMLSRHVITYILLCHGARASAYFHAHMLNAERTMQSALAAA